MWLMEQHYFKFSPEKTKNKFLPLNNSGTGLSWSLIFSLQKSQIERKITIKQLETKIKALQTFPSKPQFFIFPEKLIKLSQQTFQLLVINSVFAVVLCLCVNQTFVLFCIFSVDIAVLPFFGDNNHNNYWH